MSEEQVLPEFDPASVKRTGFIKAERGCSIATAEVMTVYVPASDYDKLIASLAQSEAERERLQGVLAGSHDAFKEAFAIATNLRDELARERELHQGLRQLLKSYRENCFCDMPGLCRDCTKYDLLEDKSKPVATEDHGA